MDHVPVYEMTEAELMSRILFRDQLVIVLDKPVNIPVHAGPKGGPSLEDYFSHLHFGYKETPRLAHRLDRDTSGCLVLGRNDRGLRRMGKLFESGQIQKTYWAVTSRAPKKSEGVINTPLRKVKLPKGWSMQPCGVNDPEAQSAVTGYKILKTYDDGRTLLELSPETGRTHQIRVHLQSIDCPIVGDWLYGENTARPESGAFPQLHLHARRIVIPLYADQPPLDVTAEAPAYFPPID
ncbi:MAG: RNA pseudouridine synthase [Alphaproteobacteria bacterium]|nr:RNA pseudouridine synthase [Alphaproteobacteria bacterium]